VTKEDFESMLLDSFVDNDAAEGTVVRGKVVAIEKDLAIIDVGLKTEGRVPLKEFGQAGRERHGRSRPVAREGSPRRELGQARREVQRQ
jgi:ribosomal protein S1